MSELTSKNYSSEGGCTRYGGRGVLLNLGSLHQTVSAGVLEDLEKPYTVPPSVHDGHTRLEGPWAVHRQSNPPSGA